MPTSELVQHMNSSSGVTSISVVFPSPSVRR